MRNTYVVRYEVQELRDVESAVRFGRDQREYGMQILWCEDYL